MWGKKSSSSSQNRLVIESEECWRGSSKTRGIYTPVAVLMLLYVSAVESLVRVSQSIAKVPLILWLTYTSHCMTETESLMYLSLEHEVIPESLYAQLASLINSVAPQYESFWVILSHIESYGVIRNQLEPYGIIHHFTEQYGTLRNYPNESGWVIMSHNESEWVTSLLMLCTWARFTLINFI